jgi:hypothetical protein
MAPPSSRPRGVAIAELGEVENQRTAIFVNIGSRCRADWNPPSILRVARDATGAKPTTQLDGNSVVDFENASAWLKVFEISRVQA